MTAGLVEKQTLFVTTLRPRALEKSVFSAVVGIPVVELDAAPVHDSALLHQGLVLAGLADVRHALATAVLAATEHPGASGGNPGAYHLVQATLIATAEPEPDGQPAAIWVAHALQGATYNGEICSLRFSLDGSDQFDMPQRATFYSVFILQNQTYYWSDRFSSMNDRWETHVWTSNEFTRIDGDGPPNPSSTARAARFNSGT